MVTGLIKCELGLVSLCASEMDESRREKRLEGVHSLLMRHNSSSALSGVGHFCGRAQLSLSLSRGECDYRYY